MTGNAVQAFADLSYLTGILSVSTSHYEALDRSSALIVQLLFLLSIFKLHLIRRMLTLNHRVKPRNCAKLVNNWPAQHSSTLSVQKNSRSSCGALYAIGVVKEEEEAEFVVKGACAVPLEPHHR